MAIGSDGLGLMLGFREPDASFSDVVDVAVRTHERVADEPATDQVLRVDLHRALSRADLKISFLRGN